MFLRSPQKTTPFFQLATGLTFYGSFFLFFCVLIGSCSSQKHMLQEKILLPDYPSASGIDFRNQTVYIIGDDANNLLILDSSLKTKDSIALFSFSEKRIPKN